MGDHSDAPGTDAGRAPGRRTRGRVLMEAGKVLTIDEPALLAESERLTRRIVKRAGLTRLVKGRWPVV